MVISLEAAGWWMSVAMGLFANCMSLMVSSMAIFIMWRGGWLKKKA